MATLKGHVGKVTSIGWTYDDLKVVSCGVDGSVYEWDVHCAKRINEVTIKSCCCNGHDVARDNFTIYAIGSDNIVREIAESQVLGEVGLPATSSLTSVTALHCGKSLFAGSTQGIIWIVPVPITNQDDWHDFPPISGDIVKMKLTYDDKWLLTISNDGTLAIWKVTDKDGRLLQSDEELPFLEEILITRADLEEKNLTISELGQNVRDIKAQSEYHRRMKEAEYQEQLKAQATLFRNEMSDLQTKLKELTSENRRLIETYQATLKERGESYQQMVESLQLESHQKIVSEYEKYHELWTLHKQLGEDYEQKLSKIREEHQTALNALISENESKLRCSAEQLEMANNNIEKLKKNFEEAVCLIEEDADQEIMNLKATYESQLNTEKHFSENLKTEMGILKKKLLGMQDEIGIQREEICRKNSEFQKLQNTMKDLQNDMNNLTEEIQDRDDLLLLKEKKIYEMKRRNDELEKMNFILEIKIRELNQIIDPINNNIKTKDMLLENLKIEVQNIKQVNIDLELKNTALKQKLHVTNATLLAEQQKVRLYRPQA